MPLDRPLAVASMLLVSSLVACGDDSPTAPSDQGAASPSAAKVPGRRHLFTFDDRRSSRFATRVTALGGKLELGDDALGFAAVSGLSDRAAAELVTEGLASTAETEAVIYLRPAGKQQKSQRNSGLQQAQIDPTLSLLFSSGLQWNMTAIQADQAWAAGKLGSPRIVAAILDTGLDYGNFDLDGLVDLDNSIDLVGEADSIAKYVASGLHPIADLNGHGTNVGTMVSSNAIVAAGVTAETTLLGVKVCTMRGSCPTAAVVEGIRYAADAGATVVNLSVGGSFPKKGNRGLIKVINRAMHYAHRKGTLVVAGAGNSALDLAADKANFHDFCDADFVVCVSATGPTGESAFGPFVNVDAFAELYSNFGRGVINVAAPGGNLVLDAGGSVVDLTPVWSLCSSTSLQFASLTPAPTDPPLGLACPPPPPGFVNLTGFVGTSQATSHVTGLAALLASQGRNFPLFIRLAIERGADDLGPSGPDAFFGKGRINVAGSLGLQKHLLAAR
jgi:lantibiotic leader peptide-processing serine protease